MQSLAAVFLPFALTWFSLSFRVPFAWDFCLPSHPPRYGDCMRAAFPLWLLRAGSGYRVPTVGRRHAREPVRAFNGYLVFTKPESECYGARRTSWLLKCPSCEAIYTCERGA